MYVICKGSPPTFSSSNVSCNTICDVMMLSRGFALHCIESEYISMELNHFHDATLGLGHTLKNVEEFQNVIYQMSLGERFQYKYKKKLTQSYVNEVFS